MPESGWDFWVNPDSLFRNAETGNLFIPARFPVSAIVALPVFGAGVSVLAGSRNKVKTFYIAAGFNGRDTLFPKPNDDFLKQSI